MPCRADRAIAGAPLGFAGPFFGGGGGTAGCRYPAPLFGWCPHPHPHPHPHILPINVIIIHLKFSCKYLLTITNGNTPLFPVTNVKGISVFYAVGNTLCESIKGGR